MEGSLPDQVERALPCLRSPPEAREAARPDRTRKDVREQDGNENDRKTRQAGDCADDSGPAAERRREQSQGLQERDRRRRARTGCDCRRRHRRRRHAPDHPPASRRSEREPEHERHADHSVAADRVRVLGEAAEPCERSAISVLETGLNGGVTVDDEQDEARGDDDGDSRADALDHADRVALRANDDGDGNGHGEQDHQRGRTAQRLVLVDGPAHRRQRQHREGRETDVKRRQRAAETARSARDHGQRDGGCQCEHDEPPRANHLGE